MSALSYRAVLPAFRRSPIMGALVVVLSVVLFFAANLDRGHEEVLSVSQQVLIDV